MSGDVRETYHAAVQHDLVDVSDATVVGVVRRPTGWFRSTVDEDVPDLGPPADLLDETKQRREDLKRAGLCDEEAHNAAWEEGDFGARYRDHLADSAAAREAVSDLAERVESGETVALVCFEGEDKRCHRHAPRDEIRRRVGE
jgi:hypothetical protein